MKCGKCPSGKQYAKGSTYCRLYGMIIRDDHEGTMKGCTEVDGQREEEVHGMAADIYGLGEWPEE